MRSKMARGRIAMVLGGMLLASAALASCSSSSPSGSSSTTAGAVLLVGTFAGHAGKYKTIQWLSMPRSPATGSSSPPAITTKTMTPLIRTPCLGRRDGGVLITTPDLHLRGMDRNTVIVDGTKAGSSGSCSGSANDQNFGPVDAQNKAQGRNGIVVWKADNVSVENLTACNFLGGAGDAGNEIWWNGGDGSGKIGLHGYQGSYLTATTTYFANNNTSAQYGVFSSNASGPASWNQLYASNFDDSGMYVGACHQECGVTINHAWMEYNALGYSGTNSGGAIVIENSQFDNNQDGLDTNTQIGGDPPAPQNGDCPNGGISPITHTHSCWVFCTTTSMTTTTPASPKSATASAGPVGTGMTVSGGRNDTVMDNTFANNGAWGTLFVPYPDSNKPSLGQTCKGKGGVEMSGFGCVFDPEGNALLHNTYVHNGYFKNPTNADFGQIDHHLGEAPELLPRQHRPPGQHAHQPRTAPAHLRQADDGADGRCDLVPAAL